MAAEQISRSQKSVDKEHQDAGSRYAAQAVATLSEAVRLGFVPSGDLDANPDFKVVRDYPDFRRLVSAEAKTGKK